MIGPAAGRHGATARVSVGGTMTHLFGSDADDDEVSVADWPRLPFLSCTSMTQQPVDASVKTERWLIALPIYERTQSKRSRTLTGLFAARLDMESWEFSGKNQMILTRLWHEKTMWVLGAAFLTRCDIARPHLDACSICTKRLSAAWFEIT